MFFLVWFNPLTWLSILRVFAIHFVQFTYRITLFTRANGWSAFYNWGHFRMSSPNFIYVGNKCQILNDVEFLTGKENCRIELHPKVKIGKRTQLVVQNGDRLTVGENTSIHSDCSVVGNVTIGRHCLFARHIFVSSYDHEFKSAPHLLIKEQDKKHKLNRPVEIHDDCWIGWGVAIKAGITIGRGSIIGANSVVTKNIPPYSIAGGVPAKIIGTRFPFSPPWLLTGSNLEHAPYFYAGFDPSENGAKMITHVSQIAMPEKSVSRTVIHLTSPLSRDLKVTKGSHSIVFSAGSILLDFPTESAFQNKLNTDLASASWQYLTLETTENITIQNVEFKP